MSLDSSHAEGSAEVNDRQGGQLSSSSTLLPDAPQGNNASISKWITKWNAGHASSKSLRTKDHLTTLPNELLTKIITVLPVREICHLRAQNRRLRNFVDTNEGYLTKDVISNHYGRIDRDHELLTNLAGVDIADVYAHYYHYYGQLDGDVDGPDWINHYAVAMALASSWARARAPDETTWLNNMEASFSCYPAVSLVWRYMSLHESQDPKRSAALLESISFKVQEDRVFAVADLRAFRRKVLSATSGSGSSAHRTEYSAMPSHFLMKRLCKARYKDLGGDYEVQMARLRTLLNLPVLPADQSLAYCVNDDKTVKVLEKASQEPSSKSKQAAVVEKLFIW